MQKTQILNAKKSKASKSTDNGEVDLPQLDDNSLCSDKTTLHDENYPKNEKAGQNSPSSLFEKCRHNVPTQADVPKRNKHSKDMQELCNEKMLKHSPEKEVHEK